MTKMAIWPKWLFGKNSTIFFVEKNCLWYPKLDYNFLLANIIVKLMALAFQNTLTFNPDITNHGSFSFLKLNNAVSLQPKKDFFTVFLTKKNIHFFAMKIRNHYDKQLTPSESRDWDDFLSKGLGYHQIQIIKLEFLQRHGTQIRVNSWTVSTNMFKKKK